MTNYFAVSALREMSPVELHQLYKLPVDVFVHEQQTPYAEIDDTDALDTTFHVLAWTRKSEHGHTALIGCARLYPGADGDETVHLGRLTAAADHRGEGLGSKLLLQTLRLAAERFPGRTVRLDAQSHLRGFYERFGFTAAGAEFDDSGVAHLPMTATPAAIAEAVKALDAAA